MNTIQYRAVYFGIYLLLLTAVCSVIVSSNLPLLGLANILIWPLLYAVGLYCGWQYGRNESDAIKAAGAIIMVIGLLIFLVLFVEGRRESAVFLFLLSIQGAHTFTLAKRRDFYFAFVVSLIIILYAASVTRSTVFIFALSLYVLIGMFTLMTSHIDEKLSQAKSGDRDLLEKGLAIPVKGLGVAALVLASSMLLYLFVPRLPALNIKATPYGGPKYYDNKEWEDEAKSGTEQGDTGAGSSSDGSGDSAAANENSSDGGGGAKTSAFGATCNTDGKDKGKNANQILFYVTADRQLYVRVNAYDRFNGSVWTNTLGEREKILGRHGFFELSGLVPEELVNQTFILEAHMTDSILASYRPVNLWFPSTVIEIGPEMAMRASAPLMKGTRFSVASAIAKVDGHPSGGDEPLFEPEPYLKLQPNHSQGVTDLAADVTSGIEDDFAKAEAIEQYLRTTYPYTQETAFRTNKGNVVDEFLFELKRGHCEYFASSMVVMLRTLDIPARLAVGFRASRYNPITGYYEVRNTDAHAWVEAYFSDYGWVTFEPTPSSTLPQKADRHLAMDSIVTYASQMIDLFTRMNPNSFWTRAILSLKQLWQKIEMFLTAFYRSAIAVLSRFTGWFAAGGWKATVLFLMAVLASMLISIWSRPYRVRLKLARLKKTDPDRFVEACFLEIEKFFGARGTKRLPHVSPMEYERMLIMKYQEQRAPIATIIRALRQVVYSPLSLRGEHLERVHAALIEIEKARIA